MMTGMMVLTPVGLKVTDGGNGNDSLVDVADGGWWFGPVMKMLSTDVEAYRVSDADAD